MLLKELNKIVSNKYHILFIILIIFSFAIRFYFRSNYLDDWDSVQFVMGLEEYSIPAHQPHPPGYPLYIFIGRIFYFFIGDSLTTFTLISAIFGTLALIPTYLISKEIFDERVGLLSAVLLSFAPAQMLFSEVVMTDIVSLFFVTFTAYLLYLGIKSTKYLYFGALMVGITAGIRMTDIIMVAMLLLILLYIRDLKKCFISGLLVLMGISAWLVPVILHTGLDTLISVQRSQWSYASGEASTLSSLGGLSLVNLFLTFKIYINLLIDGWSYAILVFILAVFALLSIILRRNTNITSNTLQFGVIFITCWLLIYVLFSNFFNLLYISRYLLPQFPPMAIIFSVSIFRLVDMQHTKWFKNILSSIFLISIIFMGFQGMMAINAIHTSSPPPVDAAYFIQVQYEPDEIIIGASESYRHLQYYLPQFDVRGLRPELINNAHDENRKVLSELPIMFYKPEITYEFQRDHKIYPKHSFVKLYENKLNTFENPIIITGWHGLEDWDGIPTRWMENDATLMIYSDENRVVDLSIKALSFYRPRSVEIYINDLLQMEAEAPSDRFAIMEAPGISLKEGANIVRFHVPEGCERPADKKELNNPDSRCLSLAVQDIRISRDIIINDPESSSISLGGGWHGLEDWSGTPARWMENDAVLLVDSGESMTAELSLKAVSFHRPRTLEIYLGDVLQVREIINASEFAELKIPVLLKEGTNLIRFHVQEGCRRPSDISELKSTDGRCLSLAFREIKVSLS